MKPVHSFVVTSHLPENISKLKELAYNYWWCWNSDAREIFIRLDRKLWEEVNHNPVLLINKLSQERLIELSENNEFIGYLNYTYNKFTRYMESQGWNDKLEDKAEGIIAYFSPEFGINESFPNYSGGLGVLSGDHLKSASDLGLKMVGVGLLYQMGYFRQHLTQNGWQNETYNYNDFFSLPINLVRDDSGEPLFISVDLPMGKAWFQVWKLMLGKIRLFLLDTNIPQNPNETYRDITDQLYGGTRDTRIQQEIVLGIGGMKTLDAMGIVPECIHINEGHAAFALIERTRQYMEKYKLSFFDAKQITRSSSVFTTHTPVPAGNEVFKIERMDNYFTEYITTLGINRETFLELGQEGSKFDPSEDFSMTVVGLRMTAFHNAVSKLHAKVSGNMWHRIWKCFPPEEVPIRAITNGIHTSTWIAREFAELFDRYLSPIWRIDTDNPKIWENMDIIPLEEIYREKQRRRVRLVLFAREYLQKRQKDFLPPDQIGKINEYLDTDALTIGFARRFATYKRALLLFKDMDRLAAILKNPENPVQIIIAGKAHPHDTAGKEVIQRIIQNVRAYGLERHVVFLEDYDMVIARLMVKGCDIWLNTPIRPMEASGTSGMKAAINGTINLSILDGWWDEGFNSKNGFSIGEGKEYSNHDEQEIIESQILYDLLEQTIVPMFYDRGKSRVPQKWITIMKESIKTIAPEFSTSRMVKDYTSQFYIPAMKNYNILSSNNGVQAIELRKWKEKVRNEWASVEVLHVGTKQNGEAFLGKAIHVNAKVKLGKLTPDDVVVQVYYGSVDSHGELKDTEHRNLDLSGSEGNIYNFEGSYLCPDTGMQGFTVRVLPIHPLLVEQSELYICKWA
jgi:starch phosphorylase